MSTDVQENNTLHISENPEEAARALRSAGIMIDTLRETVTTQSGLIEALTAQNKIQMSEIGALHDLLASQQTLTPELQACIERATKMLQTPATFVLGHGEVGVSTGTAESGEHIILFEHLKEPGAVGETIGTRPAGPAASDGALLVIDNEMGLLPLQIAVNRVAENMTGKPAPQVRLWALCEKFIADRRVICPEATVEDRVYEHAPELVAQIAEIVGYLRDKDEEEEEVE